VLYIVAVVKFPVANLHMDNSVTRIQSPDVRTTWTRPLFQSSISAGFPSPAENHIEGSLDLNRYLVKHPVATFYVRVQGDSMIDAGIAPDSILVVDRAIEADDGDIVVARLNNEFCVKRLRIKDGVIWLMPENAAYQPIRIDEEMEFEVWGKVTWSIRGHT
jgi:DNA polymerase V